MSQSSTELLLKQARCEVYPDPLFTLKAHLYSLFVGMDGGLSRNFLTTINMGTVEEVVVIYTCYKKGSDVTDRGLYDHHML